MRPRIEEDLALLRNIYSEVKHVEQAGEDWFHLARYAVPAGWRISGESVDHLPVAFLIKGDYPGAAPYGFLTPKGVTFNGAAPGNTGDPPKAVPFPGEWLHFSWSVENWAATSEVRKGSNLVAWCRSFAIRLKEGV